MFVDQPQDPPSHTEGGAPGTRRVSSWQQISRRYRAAYRFSASQPQVYGKLFCLVQASI